MPYIKQCFYVDDDADDRELFCDAVATISPEIECRTSSTGLEALSYLHENPDFNPDCIFIDMNMPMLNGVESLEEIRKISRLANTPIYLFSTMASPTFREKAEALGAKDFLEKPSSMQQMNQMLTRILLQE